MNNINYYRYCDSITLSGYDKKTFLNKWYRSNVKKFNRRFNKEWNYYHEISGSYYDSEISKGRHGMDIVGDKKFKDFEKKYSPICRHKILFSLVQLPFHIEGWLCCGWKLYYDKERHCWDYIDKYHMITKLCCQSAKFTWWDKMRFKWITGYDYEEE